MNTTRLIAIAALAFSATASFAGSSMTSMHSQNNAYRTGEGYSTVEPSNGMSTVTRAQVKAELAQARRDGSLDQVGESEGATPRAQIAEASTLTRAQVRMEARTTRSRTVNAGYIGG